MLADVKKEIATHYGVLNDGGVALRGTFLIDDNQILRHFSINDMSVGRNVEEYHRLLQAFQHNAKHGEVCPAGWKKGSPTIKTQLNRTQELLDSSTRQEMILITLGQTYLLSLFFYPFLV